MKIRLFQLIAFGVLLVGTSQTLFAQTAATPESSQTSDAAQRVRLQVREAAAALKAAQYEKARSLMLEAWQIRPAWDVAMFLAQAEMELKLYRDAAEHLEYAITNLPAVESDKLLQTLQQAMVEAKTHVGQLRVATNRDGADVLVDGQLVGKSPLTRTIFVDPGQHRLEVRHAGASAARQVELAAGASFETALDLPYTSGPVPPPADIAPAWPPATATPAEREHRSVVPVIVGGAVFAVALASAIGFKLDENAKMDRVDTLGRSLPPFSCSGAAAQSETCRQLKDAGRGADQDRKWFVASTVVAATAVVATSVYWLWPRSKAKESVGTKSIDVQGAVTPQGISATVSGRF